MSDAGRTTTTLDVKVNARDLNRLDTKLKDVFGTARARDFNRGIAGTERALMGLTSVVTRLTAELARQGQHSRHFERMENDIRDARREAEKLRAELERLRNMGGGAGGGGGSPGGGGGGGGGSPGGGPGGGPGAGRGSGGIPDYSNVGRGAPRWMGAQVGVPDASSIATAMSAIPFIGLAAAGSTMASYQMYGSALGYQTARRDTFSQLGPQGAQMLNLRMTQKARAERTVVHGNAQQALDDGMAGASKASGIPEWAMSGLHGVYSGFDKYVYNTGASKSMERAIISKARAAGHSIETIPGQDAKWNAPMSTRDLEAIGVGYGVKPGDALREAAGLSSAMGRRASAGTYDFARSAQTNFGVDMGTTGSLMGSFRRAGGMADQEQQADAVAQLIGGAVARGLENSEIGEYLASMAGFMRKQADLGQSGQSLTGLTLAGERLTRTGFTGSFATSYAMKLGEAGSSMGYGGGADPVKFMMLQKLGYGAGGKYDAESYANAMLSLQDPDSAAIAGLGTLSGMSDSMRGAGMSPAVRALMMSRLTGAMGAQVGPDAARKMAAGIAGPGVDDPTVTAGDITGVHRAAAGHSVGILAGEAGMEAGRIEAGYKSATQVQNLNGVMIDLANTAQNVAGPALDLLTNKLKGMSEAAAAWDPRAGGSGVGSAGKR